jgi:hypothetical protein
MTTRKYSIESVLAALRPAIAAQVVLFDLAQRGVNGGALVEIAQPMAWLAFLEPDERLNFHRWLWSVSRPSDDGEERETIISAQAGYCLRSIAHALNAS